MPNGLTDRQRLLVDNVANPKIATRREAGLLAGYSPKSIDAVVSEALSNPKVAHALEQKRIRKRDKASAMLEMGQDAILQRLENDPDGEYALKAVVVASSVLKEHPAADDSPDKWDHRDLDKYRRRLSLRMLRYALRSPHRARKLADQLARAIGESPTDCADVDYVESVSD